ncbi:Myb-related protein [Thraustotheca clavata]|uniref:Myb-related protein n=1 Tax=Thraustotheca clavata TaxID=74557 RepID=A0A1W0A8S1_9STRA|nr:Myb-related protein [Thraustotheca clavata]
MEKTTKQSGKKAWTAEEDAKIIALVAKLGCKHWSKLAKMMTDEKTGWVRTGKQCRERWHNHLDSTIRKEPWSKEEEELLIRAHKEHGNQWSKIAKLFHGRTDNAIKNRWFAKQRRESRRTNKSMPPYSHLASTSSFLSRLKSFHDDDDAQLTPRPTKANPSTDLYMSPKQPWISSARPESTTWSHQAMLQSATPWRYLQQMEDTSSLDINLMDPLSLDTILLREDDHTKSSLLELDLEWNTDKILV